VIPVKKNQFFSILQDGAENGVSSELQDGYDLLLLDKLAGVSGFVWDGLSFSFRHSGRVEGIR
jgi:hypothetical protein